MFSFNDPKGESVGVSLDDRNRPVGRVVVKDNDLNILVSLDGNAFQSGGHIVCTVLCWHDNG